MITIVWLVACGVFVVGVLGTAAYALYAASPLPRRADPYRDPVTHRRRWEPPHLETRDEFERRERHEAARRRVALSGNEGGSR